MKSAFVLILLFAQAASAMPVAKSLPVAKTIVRNAAFKPSWRRYPPADVLIRHWVTMYPVLTTATSSSDSCYAITDSNRGFLGLDNPLTGAPGQPEPAVAFISWQYNCLQQATSRELSDAQSMLIRNETLPDSVAPMRTWVASLGGLYGAWSDASAAKKRQLVSDLFEAKIGPFEIYEETIEGFERNAFVDRIVGEIDLATKGGQPINMILSVGASNGPLPAYFYALGLFEIEDFYMY